MASVWTIKCPVHGEVIQSEKTIPLSKDGTFSNEPLFYCDKCGIYYIHTDVAAPGTTFDYGSHKVINISDEPAQHEEKSVEVICNDVSLLKSYTNPFIPDTCYKDQEELEYIRHGLFKIAGYEKKIKGYYCQECHDFYIEEDIYDEIRMAVPERKNNKQKEKTEKESNGRFIHYTIDNIRAAGKTGENHGTFNAPRSYEECEKLYSGSFPFSLIHYAFVFRRFDIVYKILEELSASDVDKALHLKGSEEFPWITPLVCAKWNLNYLEAYDDKNGTDICSKLGVYLDEVSHIDAVMEYTDPVDAKGHDLFDIFWDGNQPILDVVCYEKQKLASEQVRTNSYSIVMDEVGTGKTVSALYAIRNMIQEKIGLSERAKVLVVCPYNKREDWQSDIRRQLGRYAHIVEQGDQGEMYEGDLKRIFFKKTEHLIIIAGQKQGTDKNGSYSALKGSVERYSESEAWDLAVIDEAHISYNNYFGIRSKQVMLLTATPIVVNAKGKRLFKDYIGLVSVILEKNSNASIDPISRSEPTHEDVYVNWFREDMGKQPSERKIRFVSCKRWNKRDDVYEQIKEEKGTLAALQYDQDDEYLYWAAVEQYGFENIHEVKKNGKIDRLISLLHENTKSYVIFCEHKYVVDNLFAKIKDEFTECVVAEKYGKYENQYGLEHVQNGQLINTLMQSLRWGKRILFITTGKTGGTGLNFGEFDGVIHYELPFTSIELEQRFGRIDRIDTIKDNKARDMVFLLNECRADENDMEINRMLYYCTTKIDITCQFMPIRNTVLYYPEFIKRNGKAIRESFECLKKEYVLSEENENKMKGLRKKIRQYEKEIKDNPCWHDIETYGRNLRLSAVEALSREKNETIPEEYYELLHTYLEYWKETKPARAAYQKMYRIFLEAKKNANNWLAIMGLIKLEEDSDVFVGTLSSDDGDEQEIVIHENIQESSAKRRNKTIQKQIEDIIQLIRECVFDEEGLKSLSFEGIFCYKDGRIYRSDFKSYREGRAWR